MEIYLSLDDLRNLFTGHGFNAVTYGALPIALLALLAELIVLQRRRNYPWSENIVSTAIAAGHGLAQALTNALIVGVIAAAAYHWRLFTIPITSSNWPLLVGLFVLADLAFYWEHRSSHSIRFMWASHSVHHSSERLTLVAAYRLAWTPVISGIWLFYLPVVWLGFPPAWVFGMASPNLTYQLFVHTELVPRIGWLEWVFNTPSAHRVHHASNLEYLDRNFGGVLLIWDRLFGTYQAERADLTTRFGLIHKRTSVYNPFILAYGEFFEMFRDAWVLRRLDVLLRPPGWSPKPVDALSPSQPPG